MMDSLDDHVPGLNNIVLTYIDYQIVSITRLLYELVRHNYNITGLQMAIITQVDSHRYQLMKTMIP
jgi:hypothetical protein